MRKFLFWNASLFVISALIGYQLGPKNNFLTRASIENAKNPFHVTNSTTDKINRRVDIVIGGDVMLGRVVMQKVIDMNSMNYPFLKIADTTSKADLTYVNLENPIVDNCPRTSDGFTFCTDPKLIDGLMFAGIDVVNLANNHIGNFGQMGIDNTIRVLDKNKIGYTGFGNLVIKDVGETRFGFIGFNLVGRDLSHEDLELVKNADRKVDVLIAGVHWGEEYKDTANSHQREEARKLVENGADVVAGHHPHWVQNIEYINGKPVFYSLGNLIFDQMWSEETKHGLMVKLKFDSGKFTDYEKIPVYIRETGQPEVQ